MDTKQKGDIAEQAAILHALKRGWGALKPIGDRLPYDLVFDISGSLVKIQAKQAWYYEPDRCFLLDNRRTKTNRRRMIRDRYSAADFDFALGYLEDRDLFYAFPVSVFIAYAGQICIVESDKQQRKPRSAIYRDAWELISHWAASRETLMRTPVKVGEASAVVIPSQALTETLEKV
jgi:PD-(D/E)XK nuclease superfamily protein